LYQHLIQNKNRKLLVDWQSRYVTFYPVPAVYGNGLNSGYPVYGNGLNSGYPVYGNG
jgi:hypothetical protein